MCPLKGLFVDAVLRESAEKHGTRGSTLHILNPTKLYVTQALLHFHRNRGDKILLFSDSVRVVQFYAEFFHLPLMIGDVSENERYSIINHFKFDSTVYALCMSAAAETGTDVPDANVIIQLSGMYGSQRQETQRLGRILRAKHSGSGNVAWYYSLVSQDTREPKDHSRRRRFLQDQGYAFQVVHSDSIINEFTKSGNTIRYYSEEKLLNLSIMKAKEFRDESRSQNIIKRAKQ